jgi:hypothetical protein
MYVLVFYSPQENARSKMHGPKFKIVLPRQTKPSNTYKNTRLSLLKTNAAVWFNRTYLSRVMIDSLMMAF